MNPIERRLVRLLSQMTLDEKLAQLGSCWAFELHTGGELDPEKMARKLKDGIGQVARLAGASAHAPAQAARDANRLQRFLLEQTRLGIPAILHEECCCGAMVLGGSIFPQPIGLASTFRPQLAEELGAHIRAQLRAIGAHQGLAPVLDVGREPRWGRVEETFGEDPTLAAHFGAAFVRGLQGERLEQGILATGKHFIGHSLSAGGLNCAPSHVGRSDLYNVLLAPFQAAVQEAGLAVMMNSYPELDGEVVAASRAILTGLLREVLGFDGLVVSDYQAIEMIHTYHNAAPCLADAARLALQAGIDVELPGVTCFGAPLKSELEAGRVSLEEIDAAVSRHLRAKFTLGIMDNPYVDEGRVLEVFETPAQRSLARRAARESMVLLKNDGLLPLGRQIGALAVIGPNAAHGRNQLGDYSYPAAREYLAQWNPDGSGLGGLELNGLLDEDVRVVSLLEGIRARVSPETQVLYAAGCDNLEGDPSGLDGALRAAQAVDVVVLALGDRSGLVPSCTTGETRESVDLKLPGLQEELARLVIGAGKPVAVVLINGRPLAIPWLAEHANAILEAWLPGEEGGEAAAEILFGDANPGGKLPITFPRHVGQLPVYYNHKPSGSKSNWYVDYVNEKVTPLFPFGHGLSYTTFEYRGLALSKKRAGPGEQVEISFILKNTGSRTGDEVVQLYTRQLYASAPRPVKELRGYLRVPLEPGEETTLSFSLPVDQLAFYDANLDLVLEPGRVLVMVGSSSEDIRLCGEFELAGEAKMPVAKRVFTTRAAAQPVS